MNIYKSIDLGVAIKQRRKKLGYTQAQLSDITGLSASFISDLERGKDTAELGKALYIANMLGLDLIVNERG